jgi:hypothetical protein
MVAMIETLVWRESGEKTERKIKQRDDETKTSRREKGNSNQAIFDCKVD